MKKRILSMTLALVMVLALLPFAALAAEDYDLSPYAEVLEGADADVFGTYYDLDGDKSPELILTRGDAESFAVDIYTLADGAAEKIFNMGFVVGPTDYRYVAVLRNAAGKVNLLINDQYSEFVGTDEDDVDWYDSHLRNQIYAVNGTAITHYATAERQELRTLSDEAGNYLYIPAESQYQIPGGNVSDDQYYDWMDRYYDEYAFVLEVSPDEAMDGFPADQLLAAAKGGFMDVPAAQYYAEPVAWAVKQGITNGTSRLTFSPEEACTRGQVVTFLWRASGSPEPKSANNPFVDVKSDDYFYKAVLWAVEKGITNGMDPTHFAPEAACTRAHVVTFLWRSHEKPAAGTENPFRDVPAGEYYTDAVLWAVAQKITNGMDATHFGPDSTCIRGQIVTFLYRDLAK